ncbi:hypothetical protein [Streptomyces sp. NPDC049813]|uniref:hypothetical protein n=1 Tax=Streptomyces sp. NPDC049813 TaxID=3365597 RepID=UPI0037AD9F68
MTVVVSSGLSALGPLGALALFGFLLLFVGVVLPSVWSRHAYRRRAARQTLAALVDALSTLARSLRRAWPPQ